MTRHEIVAIVIVAALTVLPVLLVVFVWLWLSARKRSASEAANFRELQSRVTTSLAELLPVRETAMSVERLLTGLRSRYLGIGDLDHEKMRLEKEMQGVRIDLAQLRGAYAEKRATYDRLAAEVAVFDERLAFAEMGVYAPHFDYTDSEQFKAQIIAVRDQQKRMVADKTAVFCTKTWSVDGSASKGAAMINRGIKLTLRAFNNECEAAIANTRWNNVNAMEKRVISASEQIHKMNSSLDIQISGDFIDLKLKELYLTHEYREKLKAEKEERAEAARVAKEEQRLIRDLERAEEDEARYARLLAKARQEAESVIGRKLDAFNQQIQMLEHDLAEAHARAERAKAMAERTRTGWVYVISNIGSFGEGIVKIGLTRRLDPIDRIRELGDASVPFIFDVHALIYSDDAPALERNLHGRFEATRLNLQNYRKEFFRASIEDVEDALRILAPEAPFFKDIEAQEYRETLSRRQRLLEDKAPVVAEFPSAI